MMAAKLTARQSEILTYVRRYAETHGYPPSVREIGHAMGLTSSSTVHSHLEALARKGYLRRDPSKPRALEVLGNGGPRAKSVAWPVVGTVAAGAPIEASEPVGDSSRSWYLAGEQRRRWSCERGSTRHPGYAANERSRTALTAG